MTYNFDPDRWFDNEVAALDKQISTQSLTPEEYQAALDQLVTEYEKMLERLDIRHDY